MDRVAERVIIQGGGEEDYDNLSKDLKALAKIHIVAHMGFSSRIGLKKTLADICREREIIEEDLEEAIGLELEDMVKKRYLNYSAEGTYVFSKDGEGYYLFNKATLRDKMINRIR